MGVPEQKRQLDAYEKLETRNDANRELVALKEMAARRLREDRDTAPPGPDSIPRSHKGSSAPTRRPRLPVGVERVALLRAKAARRLREDRDGGLDRG
jgi:hypothetical protein